MSLIFATQLSAIATTVLAVFAIVTALFAVLAFRKQSKEVHDQADMLAEQRKLNEEQTPVLRLQAKELRESLDERTREAAERRRAQASRVFIWQDHIKDDEFGALTVTAHVKNTSEQPIYALWFSWHDGHRPVTQNQRMRPLIPGEEATDDAEIPVGSDPDQFGVVAIFRDHAGIRWHTRPDGTFGELLPGSEPPTEARSGCSCPSTPATLAQTP